MSERWQRILLSSACVAALVALALIVWSIVDPRPIPVVVAMSIAQGVGTLSLLLYLVVVVDDLRRARVLGGDAPASAAKESAAKKSESRSEEKPT